MRLCLELLRGGVQLVSLHGCLLGLRLRLSLHTPLCTEGQELEGL